MFKTDKIAFFSLQSLNQKERNGKIIIVIKIIIIIIIIIIDKQCFKHY